MPRFSVSGKIAAGVAGGTVTRAGVVIASPAGGACWIDDAGILYGRKVGEPDVWGLRAHDGQRESKVEAIDTPATDIRAGGGVWAVWGTAGIRSNSHPPLPMAGLHDVGPDGTLAFCADRQDGRGLILRGLDGTQTVLVPPVTACRDVQVHDARNATWVQGERIRSTYGDPVTPTGVCGVPRVVTRQGQRFLLYFYRAPDGREYLLCQTDWAQPVGYVVTQEGRIDWPAHRPDLVDVDAVLRACWATSEGEGPFSIRETAISLAAPAVDFRTLSAAPVPIPSPPTPDPSPTPPEPTPVALPDYKDYVVRRCRELGLSRVNGGDNDATREKSFEILNQIAVELNALDPGIGLLEKTAGNRWRDRAIDILTWLEPGGACHHFDVIGDAEGHDGDPTPGWGYVGLINAGRWKAPYPVVAPPPPAPVLLPPGPEPVPVPSPPVPLPPVPPVCEFAPCDHAAIFARIDRIEAALLALVVQTARPRPITIKGGWLGTLTGEVGAPKL